MKKGILLLIIWSIFIFNWCAEIDNTRCSTVDKTIISVWWCDQRWNCWVGYSDWTYGREHMPVSWQIKSDYICE